MQGNSPSNDVAGPGQGASVLRVQSSPAPVSGTRENAGQVLGRILLKAVHKGSGGAGENEGKVFTLRNVCTYFMSSCMALKALIKEQLSDDN